MPFWQCFSTWKHPEINLNLGITCPNVFWNAPAFMKVWFHYRKLQMSSVSTTKTSWLLFLTFGKCSYLSENVFMWQWLYNISHIYWALTLVLQALPCTMLTTSSNCAKLLLILKPLIAFLFFKIIANVKFSYKRIQFQCPVFIMELTSAYNIKFIYNFAWGPRRANSANCSLHLMG